MSSSTERAFTALTIVLAVGPFAMGQTRISQKFGEHTFALALPAGYKLQTEGGSNPAVRTFGFATEVRTDGTRGLIQVTLVDLRKGPPGREPGLDHFAASMITGVRSRRNDWVQQESRIELTGVEGKRIQWSGSSQPSSEQKPLAMRGVMIVGIKDGLGFSLHTQDVEPLAASTVPLGEGSLMTLSLEVKR
jgi:hypothetical protein